MISLLALLIPYEYVKVLPEMPFGYYSNAKPIEELFFANEIHVVVEVGSWVGGGSTKHIGELLKKSGGKLYAVDTWLGNTTQQSGEEHYQPILAHVYQQFLSNMIHWNLTDVVIPCRMKSIEAARALNIQPDLIYIDAEHTSEAVYIDLSVWYPLVKERGILCGDDWLWPSVQKSVQRFAAEKKLQVKTTGNFWQLCEQSEGCYRTFETSVKLLYSPWICDSVFLQINNAYSDPFPEEWHWDQVRYFQYILSRNALATSGDFIECGVWMGKGIDIFASVLDRWDTEERTVYGFDSFSGLQEPGPEDLDVRTGTQYFSACTFPDMRRQTEENLLRHNCPIQLIKGWIPASFSGYEDKTFSFAHIDVDLYRVSYDALAFVYPRMVQGGIILFDDYGYPNCPGARKAIDEFLLTKPEILIPIPTGQAFLIKQ